MLKRLAILLRHHVRNGRASAILLTLLIFCGALFVVSAQQPPQQDKNKQRPRRVGASNTPAPTASTPPSSSNTDEGEEVGEGDVLRVETQLVSVPAVVYDQTGRPLVSLRAENFTLYEDERPQEISNFSTSEAPFEVALLLDTSGSTRADVALIRRAANAFIEALRPGDRVAIVSFNTVPNNPARLAQVDVETKLTSDRKILRKAVEDIGSSNGTPFYDALSRVAEDIFKEPPGKDVRGRRAVVALTDGVDSASNSDFAAARNRLLRSGIACYFVEINTEDFVEDRLLKDCEDDGRLSLSRTQLERYRKIFLPHADADDYADFCRIGPFERMQISRDLYNLARREMNDLARISGGKTFIAGNLYDARNAFAQVAAEIGTQYSLGYYPSNKTRDGQFRKIRVEVRGVNTRTQVRAREGYYAPKS
ncbi:MAG: VWA domain-containing protein [Pyrinomonadaceae bacterium]